MTLKIPTASENTMLGFTLGYATPGNQELHLYTNNITPADADVLSTYTEMTGLGYASKTLTKGNWSIAQSSGVAEATYAVQTWTFTAGTAVTVYGYYVTDASTGLLLWAERFSSAKTLQYTGDQVIVTPKFTYASGA